jgi:2-oxo-4-hydroxy-4-carboxy-5-ureidoimidazoline decarboxylase
MNALPDGNGAADASDAVERLNALTSADATARLFECCGSTRWAESVAAARPFADARQLFEEADRAWWRLNREDWLEAFRGHPKIGESKASRATGADAQRWSEEEQARARGAESATLEALAEGNGAYEERFGYIYIVCATGKSAAEMLDILNRRLSNEPDTELCVAAEEQRRITRLRLQKLLNS